MSLERDKILPYLVTESNLTGAAEFERHLGHNIWVVLAMDSDELVTSMQNSDLEELEIASPADAWQIGFDNFDKIFTAQMRPQWFPEEDGTPQFIVCNDHWLAASCFVKRDLFVWAAGHLQHQDLLVSIPNSETILIFPKTSDGDVKKMKEKIRKAERNAPDPLTLELFSLTGAGMVPVT